jgi:short-subunit dehydrogenase
MNAIVTGATKGIGLAVTTALAEKGYNIGFCARNMGDLERLQKDLAATYPEQIFIYMPTDVSQKEDILAFAQHMTDTFKNIDVLVNNAGVFIPGTVHEETDEAFEQVMATNLYSAYYLTKRFIPAMIAAKKGHIFNMCSVASVIAYPNGGSYGISKFALLGFSKALREEMKPYGIKVTAILPGATWSNSWAGVDLPEERLMLASDIAEALMSALRMSDRAVVEEIIIRPQLGDL